MTGSFALLALAAAAFVGSHFGLAASAVSGPLTARLGPWPFRMVYSTVAFITLGGLIWAYVAAPRPELWGDLAAFRWLAVLAMPFPCVLVVAGFSTPNPTAVGMEEATRGRPPGGIFKLTRHPVMWGFGLWAVLHGLANGDAASALFFGAFAVLALGGTLHIDARRRAAGGADWERLEAETANPPFLGLLQGKARLGPAEVGWGRIGGGIALYAVLLALHPWLFGVDPLRW